MREKTNEFIDDIIKTFELDEKVTILKNEKQLLLTDEEFIKKLNKLKSLDIYSKEYKSIKKDLFQDSHFVRYKQIENELNLLIMEINQRLKKLTDERGCYNENN